MKPKVKIFIIVGWLSVPKEIVYEIFNERYGYCKCWFVSKEHYLQSRFSYANTTGKKIAAIFVGPVPHKSFAAGKHSSMVTELCIANSLTPVYVCRNKSGILKFTKSSLRQAITNHEQYLQSKIDEEDTSIMEFKEFITELFPNQTIFGKNPLCVSLRVFTIEKYTPYLRHSGVKKLQPESILKDIKVF